MCPDRPLSVAIVALPDLDALVAELRADVLARA